MLKSASRGGFVAQCRGGGGLAEGEVPLTDHFALIVLPPLGCSSHSRLPTAAGFCRRAVTVRKGGVVPHLR